jgi:hypothetical protein
MSRLTALFSIQGNRKRHTDKAWFATGLPHNKHVGFSVMNAPTTPEIIPKRRHPQRIISRDADEGRNAERTGQTAQA